MTTKKIEINEEQLDVIHELILLGLDQTNPAEPEYGEAYDEFIEEADYPLQIGDQPDRVQDVWKEIMQNSGGSE